MVRCGVIPLHLALNDTANGFNNSRYKVEVYVTCCSSLWISLVDGLLKTVESKQAAENVVALCLTERLAQGVIQVCY